MKIKTAFFNNKQKAWTILPIVCLMMFGSCKKFLDVQPVTNALTIDNLADARIAVYGVYQELTGDYAYGACLSLYFPYDNDEMMGPTSSGDGNKVDITHYNITNSTSIVDQIITYPYDLLYEGIERANNCIYYIPLVPDFSNPNSPNYPELHRLYGESLTLRAQFYFDLIKNWGDVPAQFLPSSLVPNLYIAKTDRDTIYDHVLNDLQIAENNMPWYWQLANPVPGDGRLTQNAARGLRARIALFRGGWSLRQNGQMQRSSDWQTYYQIAKTECDTVILNGQNLLNTSYQAIFQNGIAVGAYDPKEVLFQIGMVNSLNNQNSNSKLGIYDGPKVTTSAGGTAITTTTHSSGGVLVLPSYFYLFDPTDSRRDVTCAPFSVGLATGSLGALAPSASIIKIYAGKFRRNWVPGGSSSSALYLGENWPLLRFSDIYLMDAEADNELNGVPSSDAQNYLTLVRKRAYGSNPAPAVPTTHDDFFNAIMKERSLEFGGEGLRKYDLIRWDSLASRIAETQSILANMYAAVSGTAPTYTYNGYVVSQLPTKMWWDNTNTAVGAIHWVSSFYLPYSSTPPAPGDAAVNWFGTTINSMVGTYALGFQPNRNELYPFNLSTLSSNPYITQNPGY